MKTKAAGGGGQSQSPTETAHYIGTLTRELAQLARGQGLDSLAYILDMACLEAEQVAKASVGASGRAA